MRIKKQLDPILEKWNLLKHPFYQAWSMGTLPVEALKVYASEYGSFISTLSDGWTTLHDAETAREEQEHAVMWEGFAAALGTQVAEPQIEQTRALIETAAELFAKPATALGAMYAFEAQQPATAQSKLEGLRTHYALPAQVEPYFEVHSANWHESEKILAALESLSPAEQIQARAACDLMAQALWDALTGIHDTAYAN
ncbi:MAG TPA: iron-containing redox enzyme family protein [Anaerolineales bacterium]|jgi:pyrroloquinoline-quinone synthase